MTMTGNFEVRHLTKNGIGKSDGGGGSISRKNSHSNVNKQLILFSTPPRYSPFLLFMLAAPLIIIVSQMALLQNHTDGDLRQSSTTWVLGWSFISIMVLYMSILPKQIDVRSNGTVTIKTFLLTFHFDSIVRAYQTGLGREDFLRPRLKFATTLGVPVLDTCGGLQDYFKKRASDTKTNRRASDSETGQPQACIRTNQDSSIDGISSTNFGDVDVNINDNEERIYQTGGRVVIRRSNGKWDVVVSPKDPIGFCNSVMDMVSMIERQKQEQNYNSDTPAINGTINENGGVNSRDVQLRSGTPHIDVGGKPDLATTSNPDIC